MLTGGIHVDLTTMWCCVDGWNARWCDRHVMLCWRVECTLICPPCGVVLTGGMHDDVTARLCCVDGWNARFMVTVRLVEVPGPRTLYWPISLGPRTLYWPISLGPRTLYWPISLGSRTMYWPISLGPRTLYWPISLGPRTLHWPISAGLQKEAWQQLSHCRQSCQGWDVYFQLVFAWHGHHLLMTELMSYNMMLPLNVLL